jgi:hypothetical protein
MKPYLSAIVILTVASIGSATFAQSTESESLRLKRDRVKQALADHPGQATYAGIELAGSGVAIYMAANVQSAHLDRLDEQIAALKQERAAKVGTSVEEAEQAYKDALALHTPEEFAANKRVLEDTYRNVDKLNDATLAKVENTPGQFKATIKQQLEDLNSAHVVTAEAQAAAVKQAKINLEAAKIFSPEVQALDIKIEDAMLARAGRWNRAAFGSVGTLGKRVAWAGTAAFLGYLGYKEIVVISKDNASPHAASAREISQLVASLSNQQ